MNVEQFIEEAMKLGMKYSQAAHSVHSSQLNTLRNLLLAKKVITEEEFDYLMDLDLKEQLERIKRGVL